MPLDDLGFLKVFSGINNDAFITGVRSLEGMQYIQTIEFLNDFLEKDPAGAKKLLLPNVKKENLDGFTHLQKRLASMLNSQKIIDDVVTNLNLTTKYLIKGMTPDEAIEKTLEDTIKTGLKKLVAEVVNLNASESIMMPGGWNGKPSGHAIAYEFQKDAQGNLLFVLYNSGSGIEYHEKNISPKDNKERYKTVKGYKIPKENVTELNLSYFITELVKPRIYPIIQGKIRKESREINYTAEVVYNQVFTKIAEIKGEEIPVKDLGKTYNDISSIGQRAGTCAQKSLHQIIKNDIPNKNTAKLIILCLKIRSIELCLERLEKLAKSNEENEFQKYLSQLELAAQNLAGILLKNKEYSFELMSNLKDNNKKNAEPGKLYIAINGAYLVCDRKGQLHEGSLPQTINLSDLEIKIKNQSFKEAVLDFTQKKGDTENIPQVLQDVARKNIEEIHEWVELNKKDIPNFVTKNLPKNLVLLGKLVVEENTDSVVKAAPTKELIKKEPYISHQNYAAEAIKGEQISIDALKTFISNIEGLLKGGLNKEAEYQIFTYLTTVPLSKAYYNFISKDSQKTIEKAKEDEVTQANEYVESMRSILQMYKKAVLANQGGSGKLDPKKTAAILNATRALELAYENTEFSLIAEPGSINEVYCYYGDNSFNKFKKEAMQNPYLGTGSGELDERIKTILNSHQNIRFHEVSLRSITEHLNLPGNHSLKKYLEELYDSLIPPLGMPVFSQHEKKLINQMNCKAIVAYFHYFERNPGLFPTEAKKVTLFKSIKKETEGIINALTYYDISQLTPDHERPDFKWIEQKNTNFESLYNWIPGTSNFGIHQEKTVKYFKEITKKEIEVALSHDFVVTEKDQRSRTGNDIYSTLVGSGKTTGEKTKETSLYQDLLYLRIDPNVQFLTTIDYFSDKLEMFSDKLSVKGKPDAVNAIKNDLQQYLRRNIFQPGILIKPLENNPDAINSFHGFAQKGILYFSDSPEITSNLLYFYQLLVDVNTYVLKIPNYPNDNKLKIVAMQEEILKKLEMADPSKITDFKNRYQLAKIKLQLHLESKNDDLEKLFNLYIDCNDSYRDVKTDCDEEREAHQALKNAYLERLNINKNKIVDYLKNWLKKNGKGLLPETVLEQILKTSPKENYPYYEWEQGGNKLLTLDLTQGQILIDGKYLSYPPSNLVNTKLYQETLGDKFPKLLVTICDVQHSSRGSAGIGKKYEIDDPKGYFLETNNQDKPWVFHAKKSIKNKNDEFYEKKELISGYRQLINEFSLLLKPAIRFTHNTRFNLPESFFGKETTYWESITGNGFYIERNNERYFCDSSSPYPRGLEELDINNQSTGYFLSHDLPNELKEIFGRFEHEKFTEIYCKYDNYGRVASIFKVKFPRYNLELQGKWDAKNNKWVIHPTGKPNLVLDMSAVPLKPLVNNGIMFKEIVGCELLLEKDLPLPEKMKPNKIYLKISNVNSQLDYIMFDPDDPKKLRTGTINVDVNSPDLTVQLLEANKREILEAITAVNPKPFKIGSEKQTFFTPNQVYYVNKLAEEARMKKKEESTFKTVYHEPILDSTNVNKRLETNGWGVSEIGIPGFPSFKASFPEGRATYANSEKYISYELVDSDIDVGNNQKVKELKANTTNDKLYLAYLNLIHLQPKDALKTIRSIIRTGGLKGTVEELEVIDKIMNGAPKLADRIDSPEFIAVRLHVLSLVSDLMERKKRVISKKMATFETKSNLFSIPVSEKMEANTPDEFFKKQHFKNLELLERKLPDLIKEQFALALKTEANMPKVMRLSRSLEYSVMSRMHLTSNDDAALLLQARYQNLKNWYRSRESANIKFLKTKRDIEIASVLRSASPEKQAAIIKAAELEKAKEESRLKTLTTKMAKGKTAMTLIKQFNEMGIKASVKLQNRFDTFNPHNIEIVDLVSSGARISNYDFPLGISDEDFLRRFMPALELTKTTNPLYEVKKKELRSFITSVLKANALTASKSQKSIIPIWCAVLQTVFDNEKEFNRIQMTEHKSYGSWDNDATRYKEYLNKVFEKAEKINHEIFVEIKGYKSQISDPLPLKLKNYKEDKYQIEPIQITEDFENLKEYKESSYDSFIAKSGLNTFSDAVLKLNSETETKVKEKKDELRKAIGNRPFSKTVEERRKADQDIGEIKNNEGKLLYEIVKKYFETQPNLRETILAQIEALIKPLDEMIEAEIQSALDLANSGPNDPKLKQKHQDKLAAGHRIPLNMADLNRLFVLADKHEYRRVTGLDDDAIQALHNTMARMVNYEVLKTQYEKIQKDLKELEDNDIKDPNKEIEVTQLARTLATRNTVNPNGEADFQFFQKEEKILMIPLQKAYVDKLLNKIEETGQYSNEVIQLIMGGGKSKVIAPLTALKKADGTNLVIFEVKNSLLEVNFADMERASGELFNQKAIMFKFDRNSPSTSNDLKQLYKKFYTASIDKNYIVTSGVSLQSLELKYLETLAHPPIKPAKIPLATPEIAELNDKNEYEFKVQYTEWERQIKWFEKSLLLLKNKGDRIIDEVHDELDPTKELNYTTGSSKPPSKEDIKLTVDLFYFLSEVSIILDGKKVVAFDLIVNNKLITKKAQLDEVMKKIAQSLITNTSAENPISAIMDKLGLDDQKKTKLVEYLLNEKDEILPDFEIKGKELTELEKNQLAFIKFELSSILPFTLSKNYNENFGPTRAENATELQKRMAIPYLAPNTPNEKARFGQFIESLNYTMQMNIIEPFSSVLIGEILDDYLTRARNELLDSPNGKLANTKASREFFEKFGHELQLIAMMNKEAFKTCCDTLSTDSKFQKSILENNILPQIKINPLVLSSNSQNLAEMTRTTQGMTGTPWNERAYHEDIYFNEFEGLGTDGETIDLLIAKKTEVCICKAEDCASVSNLLESVLITNPISNAKNVRAIIDVGALFKTEKSNRIVAEKIAEFYQKNDATLDTTTKYVLYVDNNDNQLYAVEVANINNIIKLGKSDEKEVSSILNCEPHERFTFYDQARITGTDIKQAPYANALVTMSDKTPQSSFLQGAKRMRQLANNQSVTIIQAEYLTERVNVDDKQTPIQNCMTFFNKNQAEKCLGIHLKGASQRFKNALRADLLKIIYQCKTNGKPDYTKKNELLSRFDSIFSKEYKPEHFKNYGAVESSMSSKDYFEGLRDKYQVQWQGLLKSADIEPTEDQKKAMAAKLNLLTQKAIEACDEKILSKAKPQPEHESKMKKEAAAGTTKPVVDLESSGADDLAAEVENELENEQEQEEELNIETEKVFFDPTLKKNEAEKFELKTNEPPFKKGTPIVKINDSCLFSNTKKENRFDFDPNLFISQRQEKTFEQKNNYYEHAKPVQLMMLIAPKNAPAEKMTCVLMTKEESAPYTSLSNKELSEKFNDKNVWFISPSENEMLIHGTPPTVNPENYQDILEQVRVINGDMSSLAKQKNYSWLTMSLQEKIQFFEQKMLPYNPEKEISYKILKSRLDASSKIIQYILDNPFDSHTEASLSKQFATYPKLKDETKIQIENLIKGLNEINALYADDYNDPKLSDDKQIDLMLAKYPDEETRSLIMHHKKTLLDKRIKLIKAISSEIGMDENLSQEYMGFDFGFHYKGKNIAQIALENNKSNEGVLFLIEAQKFNFEDEYAQKISNLEMIVQKYVTPEELKTVLDLIPKEKLLKYINTKKTELNLLSLAAKHNNVALLEYINENYLYPERSIVNSLSLTQNIEFARKNILEDAPGELKKWLGTSDEEGSLLYNYVYSEKYVKNKIMNYLKDDRKKINLYTEPFLSINGDVFDNNFIKDVVSNNPPISIFEYLDTKEGVFKNPDDIMLHVLETFKSSAQRLTFKPIIEILLRNKADLKSVLFKAIELNYPFDILNYFVDKTNLDLAEWKDKNNNTLLSSAILSCNDNAFKVLSQKMRTDDLNSMVDQKNNDGKSPWDLIQDPSLKNRLNQEIINWVTSVYKAKHPDPIPVPKPVAPVQPVPVFTPPQPMPAVIQPAVPTQAPQTATPVISSKNIEELEKDLKTINAEMEKMKPLYLSGNIHDHTNALGIIYKTISPIDDKNIFSKQETIDAVIEDIAKESRNMPYIETEKNNIIRVLNTVKNAGATIEPETGLNVANLLIKTWSLVKNSPTSKGYVLFCLKDNIEQGGGCLAGISGRLIQPYAAEIKACLENKRSADIKFSQSDPDLAKAIAASLMHSSLKPVASAQPVQQKTTAPVTLSQPTPPVVVTPPVVMHVTPAAQPPQQPAQPAAVANPVTPVQTQPQPQPQPPAAPAQGLQPPVAAPFVPGFAGAAVLPPPIIGGAVQTPQQKAKEVFDLAETFDGGVHNQNKVEINQAIHARCADQNEYKLIVQAFQEILEKKLKEDSQKYKMGKALLAANAFKYNAKLHPVPQPGPGGPGNP